MTEYARGVRAQIRPRRRWFMDGWEVRVSTYGNCLWGNGIEAWFRSREKAEAKAHLWALRQVEANASRARQAGGWEEL